MHNPDDALEASYILEKANDTDDIEEELQAFEIRSSDLTTLKSKFCFF